jgi:ADP-ribosyl-[dinitrogen reductase] hydrolase
MKYPSPKEGEWRRSQDGMGHSGMKNNLDLFQHLMETNQIHLGNSSIFSTPPEPLGPDFDFGLIEGMMLGLAVGDALGKPTESWLPRKRRAHFGEILDYLPNPKTGESKGLPSDDTQLAFWTLEQMLEDQGFIPERVASRFCQGRIYGIGNTVREFISNYKNGLPWYRCGPKSAGNGALMRIAPMLIPHLRSVTPLLWTDTALSAMITHNDSGSIAACLGFINILWRLLHMEQEPNPEWWPRTYVEVARKLECSVYRPRGGKHIEFQGPIWKFVEETLEESYSRGLSILEAGEIWYSGAFLLETVPSVLFILMRHAQDPEEAIIRAVNDTKDNDTIAAIVGAAVGALHGRQKIPERWLANLTGRTAEEDDDRVYELLAAAKRVWWEKEDL